MDCRVNMFSKCFLCEFLFYSGFDINLMNIQISFSVYGALYLVAVIRTKINESYNNI
jgi:hypothetical protein